MLIFCIFEFGLRISKTGIKRLWCFNHLWAWILLLWMLYITSIKLLKGWGATTLLRCTPLVQVNQAGISLVVLDKERSWVRIAWTNRALYSMHCILCIVFYALYSMHCILCIVFFATHVVVHEKHHSLLIPVFEILSPTRRTKCIEYNA